MAARTRTTQLTCYDCAEPVTSPFMPVILNTNGTYSRPGQTGDTIHTQLCPGCAHLRYMQGKDHRSPCPGCSL